MSVARYNFVNDYHFCGCGEVEDDNGEYVLHADHQKLLDENAKLRAAIDLVRRQHHRGAKGMQGTCMACGHNYPCPTLRALDVEDA